jgi:hypothetical protein
MNAKLLTSLVAVMLFSMSAHAHDCSGGANGGMDATGNQCNDPAMVATVVASGGATLSSASSPKADTNKAASCNKCADKTRVETRHVTAHQRIKHS